MLNEKYLSYENFVIWFDSLPHEQKLLRLVDGAIVDDRPTGEEILCRLPLIFRDESLTTLEALEEKIDEPSNYGIILMQAGRASLAIGCADKIICSKQIQKYMTRKTQGKSQLNFLNQKGKSRLGSRIRLRQTAEFFSEITQRMSEWDKTYQPKQLFLSCTPKLKGAWFGSMAEKNTLRKDVRWRRVPYDVGLPSQLELVRVHKLLCDAVIYDENHWILN